MNNQPLETRHQELMNNQPPETRHQELMHNQPPETRHQEYEPEKEQELEHEPSYKRSCPTSGNALHQKLYYTRSCITSGKPDTRVQVNQAPGKSDTRKVENQTPDTGNQNFRRKLEFIQEVPDTWVSPNMIFQVSPIPDIGEPEEQLGVPAQKSNQNPDRSEEQMGAQVAKSNQKTKDEPVIELDQYKHGKSNQKSVGEHSEKSNRCESNQPESTKSRSTENASPARDRGKISQPLKNSKSKDDKRSTKVRGKVDTYFSHQTAVSVAVVPSACNISNQTKPTSNIVTKDVEGVEEVEAKDMEMQKIHPEHYTVINKKEDSETIGKKIKVFEHKEMFKHKEDSEIIEKKTEVFKHKEDPEMIGKKIEPKVVREKDDNVVINNQDRFNRTPKIGEFRFDSNSFKIPKVRDSNVSEAWMEECQMEACVDIMEQSEYKKICEENAKLRNENKQLRKIVESRKNLQEFHGLKSNPKKVWDEPKGGGEGEVVTRNQANPAMPNNKYQYWSGDIHTGSTNGIIQVRDNDNNSEDDPFTRFSEVNKAPTDKDGLEEVNNKLDQISSTALSNTSYHTNELPYREEAGSKLGEDMKPRGQGKTNVQSTHMYNKAGQASPEGEDSEIVKMLSIDRTLRELKDQTNQDRMFKRGSASTPVSPVQCSATTTGSGPTPISHTPTSIPLPKAVPSTPASSTSAQDTSQGAGAQDAGNRLGTEIGEEEQHTPAPDQPTPGFAQNLVPPGPTEPPDRVPDKVPPSPTVPPDRVPDQSSRATVQPRRRLWAQPGESGGRRCEYEYSYEYESNHCDNELYQLMPPAVTSICQPLPGVTFRIDY